MGEEIMQSGREVQKRRRFGDNKQSKGKKKKMKPTNYSEFDKRKKMDPKMKKMLKRKARDYNSDTDEGGNSDVERLFEKSSGGKDEVNDKQEFEKSGGIEYEVQDDQEFEKSGGRKYEVQDEQEFEKSGGRKYGVYDKNEEEVFDDEDEEGEDGEEGEDNDGDVSEDESGKLQPGIMRFTDGCKVFQGAFRKIITKKTAADDVLGPVLSGNKRLVAEKLAENDVELKEKKEAKKEKLLVSERGHVKPDTFLDTHEKLLISIATKGVVKLFNAVNKAQQSQKGLNPSRAKDQKVIKNRRKEAFFSELGKKSSTSKVGTSTGGATDVGTPAWAPLRDDFMLTKSKLKDWDKNSDTKGDEDFVHSDSPGSSSEED